MKTTTLRSCAAVLGALAVLPAALARADDQINLTPPPMPALAQSDQAATPPLATAAPPASAGLDSILSQWMATASTATASQPEFPSPLVTTNPVLEQRYRFDVPIEHIGNGSDTTNLDGGKGLDLIVGPTEEVQIGTPPYTIHSTPTGKVDYAGWADWPFVRIKQRLLSSPADQGNYVVSAWLQIQAPTGIEKVTNRVWTLLPTIGMGKGFGLFSILANAGAAIPTAHEGTLGIQVTQNIALEYRLLRYFTPLIEFNNTVWSNGTRNGRDQLFITSGVNIGRIHVTQAVALTIVAGYQTAVTPKFQAKSLLPAYDHAWIMSTRFNF